MGAEEQSDSEWYAWHLEKTRVKELAAEMVRKHPDWGTDVGYIESALLTFGRECFEEAAQEAARHADELRSLGRNPATVAVALGINMRINGRAAELLGEETK